MPPKNVMSVEGEAWYVALKINGTEVASPAPFGAKPESSNAKRLYP